MQRHSSLVTAVFALAVFALGSIVAGCSKGPGSPDGTTVIVLGFDGMDPELTEQLIADGRLPNLARLAEQGVFQSLETSIPPQSPVAWSNFITGMDAGGHGIFDFLHRDPETYLPYASTTKLETSDRALKIGRWQIPLSSGTLESRRLGVPFWAVLEDHDVETTVIRMPANYPPSGTATYELSGMGTSDINGTDGTLSFYTSELFAFAGQDLNSNIHEVDIYDHVVTAALYGPDNPFLQEAAPLEAPFVVYIDPDRTGVKIELGNQQIVLAVGEWSDWLEVEWEMIPTQALHGICRMYLRSLKPELELYVTPVDFDPMSPASKISHPDSFAAEIAEANGRFYTEGMPEDTKMVTEKIFETDEFLAQARLAGSEPKNQYSWMLDRFLKRQGGLLFYYFGNVDQVSHIMWRARDAEHPHYVAETDAAYEDLIPQLYEELDQIVGMTVEQMPADALLVVMSDHGFTSWRRSLHLNRWLEQEGYLTLRDPNIRKDPGYFLNVDWSKTKAYGVGFSGLYINQKGRERDGIVPYAQARDLVREIGDKLLALQDPESGQPAVTQVHYSEDFANRGALDIGPDIVVGYAKGTHVDNDSAIGKFGPPEVFTSNDGAWSGDHIMDHRTVPGVLLTSRALSKEPTSLTTLAGSILSEFGIEEFPPRVEQPGRNESTTGVNASVR